FERLLADIAANRAGLPDLIQFWPAQRCYRMVEVKGPGDRLQDNQRRWLEFFIARDLPVAVCQVAWQ
ncbi:MAG: VRR-NUC domain-containing protein, partial [Alloalcanivorax venustensis]